MVLETLWVILIIGILNIPGGLFGDNGLFKPSPEDFQVDSSEGSRRIPVDQTVNTNALFS